MDKIEIKNKYLNLINEYFDQLDPYNYDNIIWDEIKNNHTLSIDKMEAINLNEYSDELSEFDINKLTTDYKVIYEDFISFVRSEKTLKSDLLTSREIFIRNIKNISEKVTSGIAFVWEKTKFLFAIPGISFASFVFTFFFDLVFSTFLVWIFPNAYTEEMEGVVEAIICALVYITIRFAIYRDVYLNRPDININVYLLKHFIACFIWWTIFYIIRYKEAYTVYSFSYIEWGLFLPYLSIGAFTHEFFISCIITYAIINAIPLIMILIYTKGMEKVFKKQEELNKKYDNDEDDEYYNKLI